MVDGPTIDAGEDHRFWELDGEPTLLAGGSSEDNLFQIPDLESELDALAAAGGSYVRNTLSSREDFAVWPFAEAEGEGEGGVGYDLETWNPEYFDRLDRFLALTAERGIVPQFELWAFHDFVRQEHWSGNPWNPANNVTYGTAATTLPEAVSGDYHGGERHPFFLTVPGADDDGTVRRHQERFVDRVLDALADYDHALVCATNEIFSQFPAAWSRHWVEYVRERSDHPVTEMFQEEDLQHPQHRESLDDPDRYDFVDASQNSRQSRDDHWAKLQWVRGRTAGDGDDRPMTHVKTYGGETVWTDGPEHGVNRFWRNAVGGAASTRFHRPPAGIGSSDRALRHVRAASLLAAAVPLHRAEPDATHDDLRDRDADEAYHTRVPGEFHVVYFPDGGSVDLDLRGEEGTYARRWLHVEGADWHGEETVEAGGRLPLDPPHGGNWVAVLTR